MPPAGARRLLAIVISVGAVTASRNLLLEDHVPHHLHPRPYHELERVYDELDNYTREDPNTSWVGDRLWSIASMALYNMTKTHYMCAAGQGRLPVRPSPRQAVSLMSL